MAPSAALQSRIKALTEALEGESNGRQRLKGNAQISPLSVMPNVVDYYHEPHILNSSSTSPTADSFSAIHPIQSVLNASRPTSPVVLGRKSSLIDFSELAPSSLKPISINGTGSTASSSSASDISLKPPLPPRVSLRLPAFSPRKPSSASVQTTSTKAPPPLPKRHASSSVSPSSPRPPKAPSLLLPSDTHTYPPASPKLRTSSGFQGRHMSSSSTSSFHSVSLSSDGGGNTQDSLDGSYEAVSSTAATSLTIHEGEHDLLPTPKPSQQEWQEERPAPPLMGNSSTRRQAPPLPPRAIQPAVSTSSLSHHRLPPIPPNARKRYDGLFERNLPQSFRKGHASGWRGPSFDLLTTEFGNDTPNVDRLHGSVVKQIWNCSKLPRGRLRQIWNECDTDSQGSLDRDTFARGMWKIDEELRKYQRRAHPSPLDSVPISYAPRAPSRAPPPPLRKPKFLLR